jgi:hypothetical protein
MKSGSDALGATENGSGSAKDEKYTPTPSVPPKMFSGAQNMKTVTDALSIAKNVSGSAKLENGTRRRRYRRKCVWERKT